MAAASESASTPAWSDALLAAALLAVDPVGLGGASLRSLAGPHRERWLNYLRELLPPATPWRRMPVQVSEGRLLGGLDLTATLRAGRPVAERGLLVEADGGFLLVAMAERLPVCIAAHLTTALDTHRVVLEREGVAEQLGTRFTVLALDEGLEPDEHPPAALRDRLAVQLDFTALTSRDQAMPHYSAAQVAAARARLAGVRVSEELITALCATAVALGIESIRAPLLSLRMARAAAALAGRDLVSQEDAALAGRLVLAPRATQLPATEPPAEPESTEPTPPEPTDSPESPPAESTQDPAPTQESALDDVVLAAVAAALPTGLLAQLAVARESVGRARTSGRAGAVQVSRRGRPAGVRRGAPRAGQRLNVVATLRGAAPWQPLRRAENQQRGRTPRRIEVRAEDFHVTHFRQRAETTTIFAIDASGSAALHRLAEAKGAIELLLADCYVRRDQVAVLAFRGPGAQLLLPPTRSLVRAKRSLAGLPGGGGTPLAAGLESALQLALSVRRRGVTPTLVVLTDGRANIARDGSPGRERAMQDALQAARQARSTGLRSVLIDTSPRPAPAGRELADALGARYVPLPQSSPAELARVVREPAV